MKAMYNGDLSVADYSKAFNTINYKTQIHKFQNHNISKSFLNWMVIDYLNDRSYYVTIDDKSFDKLTCGFGVLQESISGSILFNLC